MAARMPNNVRANIMVQIVVSKNREISHLKKIKKILKIYLTSKMNRSIISFNNTSTHKSVEVKKRKGD